MELKQYVEEKNIEMVEHDPLYILSGIGGRRINNGLITRL